MSLSVRKQYNSENTNTPLEFGIHENVVLRAVDIAPRKKEDGSLYTSHMFLKFTKMAADGSLEAESEYSIFPVKHDSKFLESSIMREVNRLAEILECYMPSEQVDQHLNPFAAVGITNTSQIETVLKDRTAMAKFNTALREGFAAVAQPLLGLTSPYRFRVKISYTRDGKYTELARDKFIESMNVSKELSALEITTKDLRAKSEAAKAVRSDAAPGAYTPPAALGMPAVGAKPAPAIPGMGVVGAATAFKPATSPALPGIGKPAAQVQPTVAPVEIPGTASPVMETATPVAEMPFTTPTSAGAGIANPLGTIPQ